MKVDYTLTYIYTYIHDIQLYIEFEGSCQTIKDWRIGFFFCLIYVPTIYYNVIKLELIMYVEVIKIESHCIIE